MPQVNAYSNKLRLALRFQLVRTIYSFNITFADIQLSILPGPYGTPPLLRLCLHCTAGHLMRLRSSSPLAGTVTRSLLTPSDSEVVTLARPPAALDPNPLTDCPHKRSGIPHMFTCLCASWRTE
jgi:hypothetical protein